MRRAACSSAASAPAKSPCMRRFQPRCCETAAIGSAATDHTEAISLMSTSQPIEAFSRSGRASSNSPSSHACTPLVPRIDVKKGRPPPLSRPAVSALMRRTAAHVGTARVVRGAVRSSIAMASSRRLGATQLQQRRSKSTPASELWGPIRRPPLGGRVRRWQTHLAPIPFRIGRRAIELRDGLCQIRKRLGQ